MFAHFFNGMMMGFYIAAPIGAVSIIYVRRALNKGFYSGLFSALGVVTAETFYACVAIYGLSFFSDFLLEWKDQMKLCGTFFLLFVGAKLLFFRPIKKVRIGKDKTLLYDYISMLLLGIFNPIAIIGFVAIFAGFGAMSLQTSAHSLIMLLGFSFASFTFCMTLIGIAMFLKERFRTKDAHLVYILNQMSGVIIIIFTIMIFTFSFLKN